jgi:hypothetical protein
MYYKEPTYENMKNKFIFSLGSSFIENTEQSLIAYLGPTTNTLVVNTNAVVPTTATSTISSSPLNFAKVNALFNPTSGISIAPTDQTTSCNITTIDLQKWVLVNIVSTQKTLDVYIDGKLGRSCILPSNIRIPKDYQLNMFSYNGFGGYVSNFSVCDYPLNPEQIWRIYMAGPGFKYGLWDYIKSLFDPTSAATYKYPAYPEPPK